MLLTFAVLAIILVLLVVSKRKGNFFCLDLSAECAAIFVCYDENCVAFLTSLLRRKRRRTRIRRGAVF